MRHLHDRAQLQIACPNIIPKVKAIKRQFSSFELMMSKKLEHVLTRGCNLEPVRYQHQQPSQKTSENQIIVLAEEMRRTSRSHCCLRAMRFKSSSLRAFSTWRLSATRVASWSRMSVISARRECTLNSRLSKASSSRRS